MWRIDRMSQRYARRMSQVVYSSIYQDQKRLLFRATSTWVYSNLQEGSCLPCSSHSLQENQTPWNRGKVRRVVANEVKNLVGGLRETGQIINLDNHSKPSVGLPFASFPSKKNDYLWQDAKKYVLESNKPESHSRDTGQVVQHL